MPSKNVTLLAMIEIIQAIGLGIIEGITEFLPISSTGHLIVASDFLGFGGEGFTEEKVKTFEIFIQLGAVLAVVWLYRSKIFRFEKEMQKLSGKVLFAFLPAAVIGLLFGSQIKEFLFIPEVVAASLIIGGVIILLLEALMKRFSVHNLANVSLKSSFGIGVFQVLAMIPGVSRSGATIMGGMGLGLDRKTATEFSFFLAIPTLGAATLYDLLQNIHLFQVEDMWILLIGFVVSFLSAFAVIKGFLRFVGSHTFRIFAWYRIVFGVLILLMV